MDTFVESQALLAVLAGDDEQARNVLADMTPSERRALMEGARKLGEFADDSNWCVDCHAFLTGRNIVTRMGAFGKARQRWCADCYDQHG